MQLITETNALPSEIAMRIEDRGLQRVLHLAVPIDGREMTFARMGIFLLDMALSDWDKLNAHEALKFLDDVTRIYRDMYYCAHVRCP